jgi:hypothetical protein
VGGDTPPVRFTVEGGDDRVRDSPPENLVLRPPEEHGGVAPPPHDVSVLVHDEGRLAVRVNGSAEPLIEAGLVVWG